MSRKWEYKIAHYWEQFPTDEQNRPQRYAVKEQEDFQDSLDEGWEPVCGWGHAGGSSWRSHVMLRRQAKK